MEKFQLKRYDKDAPTATRRDPLQDLWAWTRALRSRNYAEGILEERHTVPKHRLGNTARAVAAHAEAAAELYEQADSGPPDTSYLPIYYSLLHLSKIYILASGRSLAGARHHGASYDVSRGKQRRLRRERIKIWRKGTIILFYQALTGLPAPPIPKKTGFIIRMGSVYPLIRYISTEYRQAYPGSRFPFADLSFQFGKENGEYRLEVVASRHKHHGASVSAKRLHVLSNGRFVRHGHVFEHTQTQVLSSKRDVARQQLTSHIRRYLLYTAWRASDSTWRVRTPILIGSDWLWPEELPILLSFFHLSNVVRYDPEYLAKLKDSSDWSFLYALRDNAPLTFLELFWSFLKRQNVWVRRN